PGQVAGQLTERACGVGARHVRVHRVAADGGAVTAGRLRLDRPAHVSPGLVVTLVRADDEQRVLRGDAVRGQALEERPECLVVVLRLGDVAGATAAECGRCAGTRASRP